MTYREVIGFWFDEKHKTKWFSKDLEFDEQIRTTFLNVHTQAAKGELFSWRKNPMGRLAEIIVLDQFSRNMFRGKAETFATDDLALILAQEAVHAGTDKNLSSEEKSFLYMPFMHSESLVIHDEAMKLFAQPGLEGNFEYEILHRKIIERFGRYPHRNQTLGRTSTAEEIEFLKTPNSSF